MPFTLYEINPFDATGTYTSHWYDMVLSANGTYTSHATINLRTKGLISSLLAVASDDLFMDPTVALVQEDFVSMKSRAAGVLVTGSILIPMI